MTAASDMRLTVARLLLIVGLGAGSKLPRRSYPRLLRAAHFRPQLPACVQESAFFKSFSDGMPKSNVSRLIAKLEADLAMRLFQRTTRDVVLTPTGRALLERCEAIIANVDDAIDYVGSLGTEPQGVLKISAGIGFQAHCDGSSTAVLLRPMSSLDLGWWFPISRLDPQLRE